MYFSADKKYNDNKKTLIYSETLSSNSNFPNCKHFYLEGSIIVSSTQALWLKVIVSATFVPWLIFLAPN